MEKSYVDFMCASLISTLSENHKESFHGNDLKVVLVKNDDSKETLNTNSESLGSVVSDILRTNGTSKTIKSIKILSNNNELTEIEII